MEEILDRQFNRKDETRINRIVIVFRFLLCAYFLFSIYRIWSFNSGMQVFSESMERASFMLIFMLFTFGMIVYNIRHIQLEMKYKFVIPYFKRGFIAAFIALNLLIFFTNIAEVFRGIIEKDYGLEVPLAIGLILCITVILFREITYYRRATRLKQLKNQ